jgi:hypothetical protein
MNKFESSDSTAALDAEIAELERLLEKAKARYEVELAKAAELTQRVVEDMKRQLGEQYVELLLSEMEPGGRHH